MQTKKQHSLIVIALWAFSILTGFFSTGLAQGTAFTYEGQLSDSGGSPATGSYDFQFTLYTAPTGGTAAGSTYTAPGVPVANGLFNTTIDFGPGIFVAYSTYYLSVSVRPAGTGTYSVLNPRQQITPTPYSIYAETAGSATTALNASSLNSGGFVTLSVDGIRTIQLQPDCCNDGGPSIVGGSPVNSIGFNVVGGTIGGGGASVYQGLNYVGNLISADFGTVSGGMSNAVGGFYGTVPGGASNFAGGNFSFAAGQQAEALNNGAFVWADSQNAPFASAVNDSFNVRAEGGVNFVTSGAGITVDGQPLFPLGNAGSGLVVTQNSEGAPNITLGSTANSINSGNGVVGAVIGGGGATDGSNWGDPPGNSGNTIQGCFGVICGGVNNSAGANGFAILGESGIFDTIVGGQDNVATGDHTFIGGGWGNQVTDSGAGIVGGYQNVAGQGDSFIGCGSQNVAETGGAIGAGYQNKANYFCFVGCGYRNSATNNYDTIGGGEYNAAGGWIQGGATVAGGSHNLATNDLSTVGGGYGNQAPGLAATISGGALNQATTNGAAVPGGSNNVASGVCSFAAGQQAQALNQGSFVWADSQNAAFASTQNDQVNFRCAGGVRFTSASGGNNQTVSWTPGTGSWTFSSDRNLKDRFENVDSESVLDKVTRLPIVKWSYKGYPQRHIGAMAQDFHGLFSLNDDDKTLNDADLHGVELAAIKGLNEKLEHQNADLKEQNANLAERLKRLENAINQLANQR